MSVSLSKGERINLQKSGGGSLTEVTMGLGWDVAKSKGFFGFGGGGSIDLDASCLMFDEAKNLVDTIWFCQLQSRDGSIRHTGDNLTGAGDGDDEQIIVNLEKVPAQVKTLIFTVNSFTGQSFDKVENAFCRLVDNSNHQEIAKFNLSTQGSQTAQIMAKVYRHNNAWKMHAIGEPANGKTFQDLLPAIQSVL